MHVRLPQTMNLNGRILHVALDQETVLRRITYQICRLQELQDVLAETVREVRSFLGVDRVLIYKFHASGNGEVVAESIDENRLPSLLGLHFPADDIPEHARDLFVKARSRSIVDVATQQIGRSLLQELETEGLIFEEVRYRTVDPCHIEYLTAMGVKSSLAVPILHHDRLWGLLVAHHTEPGIVSETALQTAQLVVDQIAVAIAQSTLVTQAQEKAQRETTLHHIVSLLRSGSTPEWQAALEATVSAFQGSGGRLCLRADAAKAFFDCLANPDRDIALYTCGSQPVLPESMGYRLIEQDSVWQESCRAGDQSSWAVSDLYTMYSLWNLQSAFKATKIRSLLIVPLWSEKHLLGYLSIFRDEVQTETLWAGQVDFDQRQLYPRRSFDVWRELKQEQAREWIPAEVELAQQLALKFASALQQHELYQQVQQLNATLEDQVQKRTADLQQATEQQQVLFEVVTNMRKSLDLETIFRTATHEIRRVLQVDRVAIYRFDPDSQYDRGEVIAEDVAPEFPSALAVKIHDHCFGERFAVNYQQGRIQATPDVAALNPPDCYRSLLAQFHIKAVLTVPMLRGGRLWGLFCIHQCAQPHEWKAAEIQFASQVAAQLGVALEQADLLVQTQQQTAQLRQTLHDLQKAQTQLIQTEKMSSLGQLVAGVAHEINNPVNFIYGNVSHVSEYAEDLLQLVKLYQQHYPNPATAIREQADEIDLEFLASDLPKTLASMQLGTDRIRQIVLSLRNFSRLDQAEMKRVNIHDGIDSTLLILQHRFKASGNSRGIELLKEYGNLPLVECYAGQLNQVFMNVLSNAIDALEEAVANGKWAVENDELLQPPCIRIWTEVIVDRRVAIHIADNGSGMPNTIRRHLFDPFFTTKPIGKGTGLGLSISHQIVVEKHGGDLRCISVPGEGTEFVIEIPVMPIERRRNTAATPA